MRPLDDLSWEDFEFEQVIASEYVAWQQQNQDDEEYGIYANYPRYLQPEPSCTCGAKKLGYTAKDPKAHYDWCDVKGKRNDTRPTDPSE